MTNFVNKLVYAEDPFSVLCRNFFEDDSFFTPVIQSKIKYPIDIYEDKSGLTINVAVVGLEEKDLDISIEEGDTLKIKYDKKSGKDDPDTIWHHKGITNKSFSYGLKIAPKFDIDNISASVTKGLLTLIIPIAPDKKPRKIKFDHD
jgi:HSP20 family protein